MSIDFEQFSYRERAVSAIPITAESVPVVVAALAKVAAEGLFQKWTMKWDIDRGCYYFCFRYVDNTSDVLAQPGDWLVRSAVTGRYRVLSAEQFAEDFEAYDATAYADGAILGE